MIKVTVKVAVSGNLDKYRFCVKTPEGVAIECEFSDETLDEFLILASQVYEGTITSGSVNAEPVVKRVRTPVKVKAKPQKGKNGNRNKR